MEEIIKIIFYDEETQRELFGDKIEKDERDKLREELQKILSTKGRQLLLNFEDAWVEHTCKGMEKCYIEGFKTAIRLFKTANT